jgi:hypothetical protein
MGKDSGHPMPITLDDKKSYAAMFFNSTEVTVDKPLFESEPVWMF